MKYTQNIIAESRLTLPFTALYGLAVWVVSGLVSPYYPLESRGIMGGAWVQLLCFALCTMLMVILNNSNSLIRIYSRLVSSTFIVLTCITCFLFNSVSGAIVSLCVIASILTAFRTFQDKQSPGWTYYSFLCTGLGSLVFVNLLWYVPLLWLLMIFQLNSFSFRTFVASLFGLATPYWFLGSWLLYSGKTQWLANHFVPLAEFTLPTDIHQFTVNQLVSYLFVVALALTGTIHFLRNSYADKIRTRQLYGCFIITAGVTAILMVMQPLHYDELMRILIIAVTPLAAHFFALTHTRITDIAFKVVCIAALILTAFNLWMPSLRF